MGPDTECHPDACTCHRHSDRVKRAEESLCCRSRIVRRESATAIGRGQTHPLTHIGFMNTECLRYSYTQASPLSINSIMSPISQAQPVRAAVKLRVEVGKQPSKRPGRLWSKQPTEPRSKERAKLRTRQLSREFAGERGKGPSGQPGKRFTKRRAELRASQRAEPLTRLRARLRTEQQARQSSKRPGELPTEHQTRQRAKLRRELSTE